MHRQGLGSSPSSPQGVGQPAMHAFYKVGPRGASLVGLQDQQPCCPHRTTGAKEAVQVPRHVHFNTCIYCAAAVWNCRGFALARFKWPLPQNAEGSARLR